MIPIALLAAAVAHAAPCPRQPATSAGVMATEQQWVRAIETRNSRTLECILAPEFSDTNWRGDVVRRSAVLARLPAHRPAALKLSNLSVFRDGRFAIVHGTNTQRGSNARSSASVRFTDVFVYRGGAWRAISAQETLIAKK
jgi:hypothetical protein